MREAKQCKNKLFFNVFKNAVGTVPRTSKTDTEPPEELLRSTRDTRKTTKDCPGTQREATDAPAGRPRASQGAPRKTVMAQNSGKQTVFQCFQKRALHSSKGFQNKTESSAEPPKSPKDH